MGLRQVAQLTEKPNSLGPTAALCRRDGGKMRLFGSDGTCAVPDATLVGAPALEAVRPALEKLGQSDGWPAAGC